MEAPATPATVAAAWTFVMLKLEVNICYFAQSQIDKDQQKFQLKFLLLFLVYCVLYNVLQETFKDESIS